jgi:hypothetical protein
MSREAIVAAIAIAFCIGGCSAPRSPRIITNPDPSGKIPAMKKAVREKDLSAVRQLVKDLDNDDPAVRMFAIQALEELTGQRYGYTYFHDELQRKAALDRWKDWLAQQEGSAPNVPAPPTTRPADESRLVGSKPGD